MSAALRQALGKIVGERGLADAGDPLFSRDATEAEGLSGKPAAVVMPGDTDEVAAVVRWCYAHDVPIVPRGGGTGFAGGCVPVTGGVVVGLARMKRVLAFEPELWRIHVQAGLTTAEVRRLARENGLLFGPDPGAAEQSQIGGNLATNAGGPHALKYGVTSHWVTGVEAVLAPGEVVRLGGPVRKDVAGYDTAGLLIGSEGTLGIITAAWLRLIPAPEAAIPLVATYPGAAEGCAAVRAVLGNGIVAAALEFLDAGALAAARGAYPFALPEGAAFMLIAEVDGSATETQALARELSEVLEDGALGVHRPQGAAEVAQLWRWRDGVSFAVQAVLGGKVSEDIVVPPERLHEAIETTLSVAGQHHLQGCSWGHAGDGNLHSTFLVDPGSPEQVAGAHEAAAQLYSMAARLGGSISGEHGLGWVKRGHLGLVLNPAALAMHAAIKRTLDPKGLMNPGKKT